MSESIFDWQRVETLLGTRLHLDSERTSKFPKISEKDNVAQVTRKIMNYVKRSQDTTDLSVEDVSSMIGMKPLGIEVSGQLEKEIRSLVKTDPDERIYWFSTGEERPVAVCLSSSAEKTGCWRLRTQKIGDRTEFKVINLAHYSLGRQYADLFKADHPEYNPQVVDMYVNQMVDNTNSGKKYAHHWSEDRWSKEVELFITASLDLGMVRSLIPDNVLLSDTQERKAWVQMLGEDEVRQILDRVPTRTSDYGSKQEFYDCGINGSFSKTYIDNQIIRDGLPGNQREMNRYWRIFLEKQFDIEYSAELQRSYVRENSTEHSATVYQQKKNIPQTHLDAAETSLFKTSKDFTHVEIDSDVELASFNKIEKEYDLVRNFTGTTKPPTLRFRKTGRHKALGVYHPFFDNIAVDPRHPSSFIHEYAHHLDHTYGSRNLSSSPEFEKVLRKSQNALKQLKGVIPAKQLAYFMTPTEVFARSSELYYHWRGLDTSLNGDTEKYSAPQFAVMKRYKQEILAYWDSAIEKMGGTIPTEQSLKHQLEANIQHEKASIEAPAPIEPIGHGKQFSLFDDAPDEPAPMEETKTTPQDTKLESKTIEGKVEQPSLLDWQETANRYANRQVDWQQIAKYAPEANEPEQTRNCQYEYDYPAQETQSGDHGIGL